MIISKEKLTEVNKNDIRFLLQDLSDIYCDFYITKKNFRYYIKENTNMLFATEKQGDKVFYTLEGGLALLYGIADKSDRIYLKILAVNNDIYNDLLDCIIEKYKKPIFIKIKKNNPLKYILKNKGFNLLTKENGNCSGRGQELLLYKK